MSEVRAFGTYRRYANELPDRPLVGEEYMNGTSLYVVLYDCWEQDFCIVQRPKDGWTCTAHRPRLYEMEYGNIELQWAYSTDGRFEFY